ncbi:MAG: hypothetical protein Q7N95_15290 [Alphaproteobacteria bacterium]|nr:hypothetical protein [Alphaproteobacteria bacterium]
MMKSPAELIADAERALGRMEKGIRQSTTTRPCWPWSAGPDAETAIPGMHRILPYIGGLADDLRAYHYDASQAVRRLANP